MLCPFLVAEEEYEEMDDYFGDEEYNEKESEEGKQIILLLWVNSTLSYNLFNHLCKPRNCKVACNELPPG